MQRCLQLAACGRGWVAPNPMVGAVLVHQDKIIGEGYHQAWGEAHAEVNAIRSCRQSELFPVSTIYVNLEPCSHHGKTPPCADLIVTSGIPRIVVANTDPNPVVNGEGIRRLREAGAEVVSGVLEKEGVQLNRRFFTFHEKKRPYVVLKWAQTADGFMDRLRSNEEKGIHWISGPKSRLLVHKWRAEEAAVLVGGHTMMNDQPDLTNRTMFGRTPLRIVVGDASSFHPEQPLFLQGTPILLATPETSIVPPEITAMEHVHRWTFKKNALPGFMEHLHAIGVQSVLVEGGAQTLNTFLNTNLWDEARVFTNENLSWEKGLAAPLMNTTPFSTEYIENDRLQVFFAR
jgi:diaminohydroxyphosphoribosylaminopyrimidine deaminase / 5-amino-6-(5-phosphoribosylamino)uracil reductase